MAGKYIAWTTFRTKVNEWGQVEEKVVPGEEVDAGKLGVTDEEFQGYIEIGAVSEEEYPDIPDNVSPAEFERSKLALDSAKQELEMRVQELTPPDEVAAAPADESAPAEKTTTTVSKSTTTTGS